jgi:hypothetical protein
MGSPVLGIRESQLGINARFRDACQVASMLLVRDVVDAEVNLQPL